MKRIGILTSGGDCGGLNAVLKGAGQMAHACGISCFIIPKGYAGLYNLVEFDKLVELTAQRADLIDSYLAGSEAGHSRVKIKKIEDENKYTRIKEGLQKFALEGLIVSGGDDTGNVLIDLTKQGVRCVHAPKTMDLDLQTYSVGADSTINRIAQFAEDIKTTGNSHNRIIVMEVFGRYAGHTAFRGGVAASADAILIPEIPVDFDILYQHTKKKFFQRLSESDVKSGTYLIMVAEGLKDVSGKEIVDELTPTDAFGHKRLAGAGKYVCQELTRRFENDPEIPQLMKREKMYVKGFYEIPEVRTASPGHLVRSGQTSAFDVNFGKEAGAAAVLLLLKGITGVTVVKVTGNQIQYMPTEHAIKPRYVSLDQVAFHENTGVCFGRKSVPLKLEYLEVPGSSIERHL